MTQNFSQNTVQSTLGYYFKTPNMLQAAFTHVSFSDTDNNLMLVFLGERLLDFIISDYVCSHYPFSTEKQLKPRFDSFKRLLNYQNFVSDKKLSKYIRLSVNNESLRESKSLHGEIFLAIAAAIYKDGGLPSLKAFIFPLVRAVDSEERYRAVGKESSVKADFNTGKAENLTNIKSSKIKKDVKPEKNNDEKNLKLKKDAKNQKNTEEKHSEKSEKKGVNLFKAIILPSKGRKKDTEASAEVNDKEETEVKEERRSFIRDALAPVSLPESMKNPKPKRPFKTTKDTPISKDAEAQKNSLSVSDDSENYKSLLQEYVQKNIHSANVLIKYNSVRSGKLFVADVSLDGKPLAKAEGTVKKDAEKAAAKIAYEQLCDSKSSLSSWFSSLSTLTPEKTPSNYISRLNEYYQKKSRSSAAPLTYEPRPSGERKTFAVAIMFNGDELSTGIGHTVKDAKQDAAKKACEKLNIK